ncbi:MAG: TRAM domain-containing protein, partial [Dysgonamonadaceae bacterium]
NVPEEVKKKRLQEIIDLQRKLSEESNKKDVGKEFEVLIEGFSKKSRNQFFGRTDESKVVVFNKKAHRIGETIKVKINDYTSATLLGESISQ